MSGKKRAKGAVIMIAVLVTVLIAVSVYLASGMTAEEAAVFGEKAKDFVVERVVPVALGILAGIGVMLGLLAPAIAKIKSGADRFGDATEAMRGAESQTMQARDEMGVFKADTLAGMSAALGEMKALNEAEIGHMKAEVDEACSKISGVASDVAAVLELAQRLTEAEAVKAAADPVLVSAGKAREVVEIVKGLGDRHE